MRVCSFVVTMPFWLSTQVLAAPAAHPDKIELKGQIVQEGDHYLVKAGKRAVKLRKDLVTVNNGKAYLDANPDWIPHFGKATRQGDSYLLELGRGYSAVVKRSDVRIVNGLIEIKKGASSMVKTGSAGPKADQCVQQDDCPSKCSFCVPVAWGFVPGACSRWCCGGDGPRGFGLGIWGC